jgi:mono/diheme cytochrome c family protein
MGMTPKSPARSIRSWHRIALLLTGTVAACAVATSASNVRSPLEADLLPGATTGPQTPLRFDPNAKVIRSTAADLPAASFLASQADRGARIYENSCSTCHAPGTLVGQGFVENWNNRRVYDLFALVRNTMPLDNPGGLKEGEYLDIVSYLMRANHQSAGAMDSLRADTASLRKTRLALTPP